MKRRRWTQSVLIGMILLLWGSLITVAAEEVIATITVVADETYNFVVEADGTIVTAQQCVSESEGEVTYTFDEEGNLVVVVPEDVDLTEDFAGTSIADGIHELVGASSFTFDVVTNPESQELEDFLIDLINGEEEEKGKNPNTLRFENADALGITNGKMHLIEKLEDSSDGEEVDVTEWSEMAVKDIQKETQKNRKGTE